MFTDAGDSIRVRWLNLELSGYGNVEFGPLHVVLGTSPSERLAAHVAAYRMQKGFYSSDAASHAVEFRHFFVESLPEVVLARSTAVEVIAPTLELFFSDTSVALGRPRSGVFGRDVFDRIVGGFVATLHLQLAVLAR